MLARKCRKPIAASAARTRPGMTLSGLVSALLGVALVTTAILVALLWQGAIQPGADGAMHRSGLTQPMQGATPPEIALSSPERLEAKTGEEIDFLLAIDATEQLPSRCVIASAACLTAPHSQKAVPMAQPDGACGPTRSASCGSDYRKREAALSTCESNCLPRTELCWPNPKRD